MNAKQEAKRSMFLVVEELINNTDPTVLAAMPNFTPYFDEFKDGLANLRVASEEQVYSRIGYHIEKMEQRALMSNLCLNIINRVKAYATNEGNAILFELMNRKKSSLDRLNDTLILDYCQKVHDESFSLLASLGTYGIVAADLVALQEAINAYLLLIPKPRFEIVERKEATRNIANAISLCSEKIEKIDILVSMLEFSNRPFYLKYFDDRKLVNPGVRTLSLRGVVTNESGQELRGVMVRIPTLNLERRTTAKGNYEMKNIPPGVYTVVFEKEGMQTQSIPVAISANERTDLNVTLVVNLPFLMVS